MDDLPPETAGARWSAHTDPQAGGGGPPHHSPLTRFRFSNITQGLARPGLGAVVLEVATDPFIERASETDNSQVSEKGSDTRGKGGGKSSEGGSGLSLGKRDSEPVPFTMAPQCHALGSQKQRFY